MRRSPFNPSRIRLKRTAMKRGGRLARVSLKNAVRHSRLSFKWSREVLKRDDYRCQWPGGCSTGDARIDPHHIAERSLRPDLRHVVENGITLCRTHHNWLPLHRAEAIRIGLLGDETYEKAAKEKVAA